MSEPGDTRCAVSEAENELGPGRTIPTIIKKNDAHLDEMRRELYRKERLDFLDWLYERGKNPHKGEGYSAYTVYETNYRTAEFERFAWDEHGGYTYPPTHDHAEAWNDQLKMRDVKNSTKGKAQEAVMRLFDWRYHKYDGERWEPASQSQFDSAGSTKHDTPDYLDLEERRLIREGAIDYCGDWKRVSLVWVSLDCGLRPIEVYRARDYWFKPDQQKVIIPADESSKGGDDKQVREMNDQAAHAVEEWLGERSEEGVYADTDAMWLTRDGNPYGDKSLRRLIRNIAEHVGIETRGRQMTWYAIRHSVGTYLTAERDLKAAKKQLGHSNVESTLRYDNVTGDDIREALDKMG